MRHFYYAGLKNKTWDNEIVNYLSLIPEYKGKQSSYIHQKPSEMERLVEIAKVQSTEASNSIEGIRTTETRLRQLMNEKTTPRNRDEKEIAGYRDALNIIHENFEYIPFMIDIDLPKTDNMDIGTYTVKTVEGDRIQISAGMMMPWYFAVAYK